MKKVIYYLVIVLLSVVLIVSAGIAVKTYFAYKKVDDVYKDMQNRFVETSTDPTNTETPTEETQQSESKETARLLSRRWLTTRCNVCIYGQNKYD